MHYIIGTSFKIPTLQQQTVRPSVVSSAVGGSTAATTAREWADFESGHSYSLYNIQKVDDGVKYTFKSLSGAGTVEKIFESANAGDIYISKIRRESLPDYGVFYENRND